MYTAIYILYFYLKKKQKKKIEANKKTGVVIQKMLNRIEWFYNIPVRRWFTRHPSKKYGLNRMPREQKIIISLTSYPKRIDILWLTIETLLRQTVKPDEVILWLAENQFEGFEALPKELLDQQKRGLTIRFCDDLRSHKKYFYVFQEYPRDLVILADDDMFYPYDTVEKLMELHKKYPQDICTMTAQVIEPEFETMPSKWRNPKAEEKFIHADNIQIYTGSGSLYPPSVVDSLAFDKNLVKKLCPYADDLWLTFMAHRIGTKITAVSPWRAFPVTIYGSAEGSLWYLNAERGQNDVQWAAMLAYFKGE